MNAFDVIVRTFKKINQPDLSHIITRAARFIFPKDPQQWLPKTYNEETIDWMNEYFHLPFQYTSIEDPASTIILIDEHKNSVGFSEPRRFIECITLNTDASHFRGNLSGSFNNICNINENLSIISMGIIKVEFNNDKFNAHGDLYKLLFVHSRTGEIELQVDGDKLYHDMPQAHRETLVNPLVAMQEVMQLNKPDRFILKETPIGALKKQQKKQKKAIIPMSHERPTYMLLTPDEIRTKTGMSTLSGSKRSHERRKHTRTFKSEKFTKSKGKTIVIPATWVGEDRIIQGNKEYRVLLDR